MPAGGEVLSTSDVLGPDGSTLTLPGTRPALRSAAIACVTESPDTFGTGTSGAFDAPLVGADALADVVELDAVVEGVELPHPAMIRNTIAVHANPSRATPGDTYRRVTAPVCVDNLQGGSGRAGRFTSKLDPTLRGYWSTSGRWLGSPPERPATGRNGHLVYRPASGGPRSVHRSWPRSADRSPPIRWSRVDGARRAARPPAIHQVGSWAPLIGCDPPSLGAMCGLSSGRGDLRSWSC